MTLRKSLISIALVLSLPASAATVYEKDDVSLDLFGRIDVKACNGAAAAFDDPSNYKGSDNTILNSARLGLSGRSKINDNLYAIALAEWDLASGDSYDGMKARHQFIGLDAQNYGTLTFGRGDNAFYTVSGATDIFHTLDLEVNDYYLTGDQNSGLVMYSLSSLGWDVRASFGSAKSKVNETPINYKYQLALGVSTLLASNISVSYGLAYYKLSYEGDINSQIDYFGKKMKNMYSLLDSETFSFANANRPEHKIDKGVSLAYGTLGNGLYLATNFTWTRYQHFSHHLYSYEAVADYAFENGLGISLGYGAKTFHHTQIISDLNLAVRYKLNENFRFFCEGQIDLGANPDVYYTKEEIIDKTLGENKVVLGAEYLF